MMSSPCVTPILLMGELMGSYQLGRKQSIHRVGLVTNLQQELA